MTTHDVFRHQYIVMAHSFLDTEKKEVIIEKVLPRMQGVLDAGRNKFSQQSWDDKAKDATCGDET